jgi:hypothetical protein
MTFYSINTGSGNRLEFLGTNYLIAGISASTYAHIFMTCTVIQSSGKIYMWSGGGVGIGNTAMYGWGLFYDIDIQNNAGNAIDGGKLRITNLYSDSNAGGIKSQGDIIIENATITEATEFPTLGNNFLYCNHLVKITKLDGSAGNSWQASDALTINLQTSEKPADATYAWKISPTSNVRRSTYKAVLKLGTFRVTANNQCTFKVRMKKSNANINGDIFVEGNIIAGVDDTAVVSSNTTDWTDGNSLLTLTCTPTADGFIDLWARAWYPNNSSTHTYSVYVAHPAADGNGNIPLFVQA